MFSTEGVREKLQSITYVVASHFPTPSASAALYLWSLTSQQGLLVTWSERERSEPQIVSMYSIAVVKSWLP